MTSSAPIPSQNLFFIKNIILLEKIKTYLEVSPLKSKFNYSLIFSTLSSNYLMYTDINEINLYSYLKTYPEFSIKSDHGSSSNDIADMSISDTFLLSEEPEYNFLYFILVLFILMQALVFFSNEYKITEDKIDIVKNMSFEDIYNYFCINNSLDYYNKFSFDRYFYFPMTCENMYEITNRFVSNYPTLPQVIALMESYEL